MANFTVLTKLKRDGSPRFPTIRFFVSYSVHNALEVENSITAP